MNEIYAKMMEEKLERIAIALESTAKYLKVFVEEGINIYDHEVGPEDMN